MDTTCSERTSICDLFGTHACKTPEAIAIVHEGKSYSYRTLAEQSDDIATALIAVGVCEGTIVAIRMERGFQLAATILGTLKAGAVYLPIDINCPADRVDFMLLDAKPSAIVVEAPDDRLLTEFPEVTTTFNNLPSGSKILPAKPISELAYCIYTSGSTGRPKGVLVKMSSLLNVIVSMNETLQLTSEDRWLSVTNVGFDMFGPELFCPITSGGVCVISGPGDVRDPERIIDLCKSNRITIMQATPSTWRLLAHAHSVLWIDKVICGGEALTPNVSEILLSMSNTAWNFYGPTETTVWSSCAVIRPTNHLSVGLPLANTRIYILGEDGQPIAAGIVGEVYIGGAGVAKGYLNRDQLTGERFVNVAGERLYRTGDLGRWSKSGEIEILGRNDTQVKINGHRIELGEVENVLLEHSSLVAAVVLATEGRFGQMTLHAFVELGKDESIDNASLMEFASRRLPAYMLPREITPVHRLPLTMNGKIDRQILTSALPPREECLPLAPTASSKLEAYLANVWRDVLGVNQVKMDDCFFRLGGDSLSVAIAVEQICTEIQISIRAETLFKNSVFRDFCRVISSLDKGYGREMSQGLVHGSMTTISLSQAEHWVLRENRRRFVCRAALKVGVSKCRIEEAIVGLTERHSILRSFFRRSEDGISLAYQETVSVNSVVPAFDWSLGEIVEGLVAAANGVADFDVFIGPLMRVYICEVALEETVFLLDVSHIIVDGVSMDLIVHDLLKSLSSNSWRGETPKRLYEDFIRRERLFATGERLAAARHYWREELKEITGYLESPGLKRRPPRFSFKGLRVDAPLTPQVQALLIRAAARHSSTVSQLMITAFGRMLLSFTDSDIVSLSMPIENRHIAGFKNTIGYFANQTICLFKLTDAASPAVMLATTKSKLIRNMAWDWYPYHSKERLIDIEESLAYCSKLQYKYSHKSTAASKDTPNGDSPIAWEALQLEKEGAVMAINEIALYTEQTGAHLSSHFIFSEDLFSKTEADLFVAGFQAVVLEFCEALTACSAS